MSDWRDDDATATESVSTSQDGIDQNTSCSSEVDDQRTSRHDMNTRPKGSYYEKLNLGLMTLLSLAFLVVGVVGLLQYTKPGAGSAERQAAAAEWSNYYTFVLEVCPFDQSRNVSNPACPQQENDPISPPPLPDGGKTHSIARYFAKRLEPYVDAQNFLETKFRGAECRCHAGFCGEAVAKHAAAEQLTRSHARDLPLKMPLNAASWYPEGETDGVPSPHDTSGLTLPLPPSESKAPKGCMIAAMLLIVSMQLWLLPSCSRAAFQKNCSSGGEVDPSAHPQTANSRGGIPRWVPTSSLKSCYVAQSAILLSICLYHTAALARWQGSSTIFQHCSLHVFGQRAYTAAEIHKDFPATCWKVFADATTFELHDRVPVWSAWMAFIDQKIGTNALSDTVLILVLLMQLCSIIFMSQLCTHLLRSARTQGRAGTYISSIGRTHNRDHLLQPTECESKLALLEHQTHEDDGSFLQLLDLIAST